MRILAIRGKDLASLAGEFEIPLDADPLSTSGVFAVVGKTGAGKSTLLDALCLPLFDATPRLDARGGAPIGDEGGVDRYPANDVRNLVRKGATSAYAEVDFIGVDGHAYRARWEASRAYDKLDRELKVRALVFTRIDTGARVADGKKAVKQAIVDKLGLTFEQARRSMLLAQNEFARFLSASGDERAQLLEQITGTEIYSHLSRAAFERAREARTELEKQQALLGEDAPLGDEARAELETEVTSLRSAAKAKRDELGTLEAAAAWGAQEEKLQLDLGEAKTDLAEAVRIHAESAELARDLKEVRAAERLRPLRDEVLRAQNGERVATQRLEDARAAVAQAEAHIEAHAPVLDAAKACAVEAQAALESARPSLHDARGLDAKLEPFRRPRPRRSRSFGRWPRRASRSRGRKRACPPRWPGSTEPLARQRRGSPSTRPTSASRRSGTARSPSSASSSRRGMRRSAPRRSASGSRASTSSPSRRSSRPRLR